MTQPIHVLFVCADNATRSPIAEALLAKKGGARFRVASAGIHPGSSTPREVSDALEEVGCAWPMRSPTGLPDVAREPWDLIIALRDREREPCPTLPLGRVFTCWDVPDPLHAADPARRPAAVRATLTVIAWRIDLMLTLRTEALKLLVDEERLRRGEPAGRGTDP